MVDYFLQYVRNNRSFYNSNLNLNRMKHVVIIGAGPCGLSAGVALADKNISVTILERRNHVGGAGATRRHKDVFVDYGPHLYHPNSDEITNIVKRFSDGQYFESDMRQQLFLKGKLLSYPLKMQEALFKLSPITNARIICDYVIQRIFNFISPKEVISFEDWGVQSFGRTLYDMCFGNYTKKVWGIDPSLLSSRLAAEKLSKLSLRKIIINLIRGWDKMEGYLGVRNYGYHQKGIRSS